MAHEEGEAAEHPPHLQHHFETSAQQFDAGKLGMWVFLMTEILFFSGLFCAYAVYRATHPEIFEIGHTFLDTSMGAINTVVLIASSFTMALAVYYAQTSRRKALIVCLVLTFLGACGFMGIKAVEYTEKIKLGKVWGAKFDPVHHDDHAAGDHNAAAHGTQTDAQPAAENNEHADAAGDNAHAAQPAEPVSDHAAAATAEEPPGIERSQIAPAAEGPAGLAPRKAADIAHGPPANYSRRDLQIFMGIYFCLTGLHGIHVLAGMIVIGWLIRGAIQGRYHGDYYTPVDLGGLYWHLVDLIWIYLFPLLYLIH